jgi:two-component system, cell cycle response regulator CtrA
MLLAALRGNRIETAKANGCGCDACTSLLRRRSVTGLGCVKTRRRGEPIEWTLRQVAISAVRILERNQNLPDTSGFEVLRTLRVSKVKTPILILSGLAGIDDKVSGLGYGADDYMTKPFHKDELVARIHAIVRRSKGHAQSVIQTGDLVVNLDSKTVEVDGANVHLTGKEYQMLELLSLRKGTTLTKEMFLNHLYGGMDEPGGKIIDVFICKLRKKLANASDGKDYIETAWGRGYVLRDPSEDETRISA